MTACMLSNPVATMPIMLLALHRFIGFRLPDQATGMPEPMTPVAFFLFVSYKDRKCRFSDAPTETGPGNGHAIRGDSGKRIPRFLPDC